MIRITDRTLSCLDGKNADASDVSRFLELLIQAEVDGIELSQKMYGLLAPLPEYPSYILRINHVEERAKYPELSRFVCRNAPNTLGVCTEIVLGDVREAYTIARYADYTRVRVRGPDDCLMGDYTQTFKYLSKAFRGEIEFSPTNRFYCASALAAEWAAGGFGNSVVTSFGGAGGFAPTEELIMILRVQRLRKVSKTYEFFPEMADLFGKIIGENVPPNKPVIGKRILYVESGVHVDGILKQPKCYEPFPPEVVGRARKILLGKQSGSASVQAKLDELGIEYAREHIPLILERVKTLGTEKNGQVTDSELAEIARSYNTRVPRAVNR